MIAKNKKINKRLYNRKERGNKLQKELPKRYAYMQSNGTVNLIEQSVTVYYQTAEQIKCGRG